jgi:hypothetical protein
MDQVSTQFLPTRLMRLLAEIGELVLDGGVY